MPQTPHRDPTLIFEWQKPRGQWPRLAFWIFISMLGLGTFLALFRVVYPQTQRFTPVAQQITILEEDNPAARAVLNSVQDRDFLMIPAREGEKSSVNLSDRSPVFHPSFEKHELKLHDLPQRSTKPQPVRLLDVTEPLLPRPDLTDLQRDPPRPPAPAAQKLSLQFQGGLAHRAVVSQPDFSAVKVGDAESWRFHLGVDARGRVVFSLPLDAPGKLEDAAPLLRLLQQVHFAPETATDKPVWGTATLVWKSAAP